MKIVSIDKVHLTERQRSQIEAGPLTELKESILGRGLLHPPVVAYQNDEYFLVAGERRYRAIQQIHKENKSFLCHNELIAVGQIPITLFSETLTEADRFEAELDENIRRVDIPWQDRAKALARLHALRQAQNPKQTIQATAAEVSNSAGTSQDHMRRRIHEATKIVANLSNPKIQNARNATEAYSLIEKLEEEKINAALARKVAATRPQKNDIELRQGDLRILLATLPPHTFDLILADPPYGIDASSGGFRARTVHHHDYSDTQAEARELATVILTEGFRITKPRANLLLFTDIKHWEWLQTVSASMGWTPFRRPLIWIKSDSEGLAPWGGSGPRITTEFIFFATKGSRGLHASPTDVFRFNRVAKGERLHAAEKPVDLLRKLIECSTLPGDFVLDPCCGSGSTLVACRGVRRRGMGIEKDPDYFRTAEANLFKSLQNDPTEPPAMA